MKQITGLLNFQLKAGHRPIYRETAGIHPKSTPETAENTDLLR
jgi:hypothetical protein